MPDVDHPPQTGEQPVAAEPAPVGRHAAPDVSPPPRGGWGALRTALRPRATRSQLLVAVLCALLGFAIVVQVRQNQEGDLSSLRQSDLVRLLDDVTARTQSLEKERSELQATRARLEAGSGSREEAVRLAEQRATVQGILSGRLPATGPGVTITVTDPSGGVSAATMFDVLEELRNAGAEAVQVNGVRLVASSWFEVRDGVLVAHDVPISSPYRWVAIGDPDTLAPALGIPGGALATLRTSGATAELQSSRSLDVTATREPGAPRFATPVPASTAGTS